MVRRRSRAVSNHEATRPILRDAAIWPLLRMRAAYVPTQWLSQDDIRLPLRAQLPPVEFFLKLMKGVVADIFGLAQPEDRSSRGTDRAPPQRVCRQFAGSNAAIGIALRAQ